MKPSRTSGVRVGMLVGGGAVAVAVDFTGGSFVWYCVEIGVGTICRVVFVGGEA